MNNYYVQTDTKQATKYLKTNNYQTNHFQAI